MAFKFNPITGNLDLDSGGSGGSSGASDAAWTTVTGSTHDDLAIGTKALRFSTNGAVIRGIVAQADGTEIVLYNASSTAQSIINEGTSSAAANRFSHASSFVNTLRPSQGARYKYSTTVSRWVLVDQLSSSGTSPIAVSTNNVVSIQNATTGQTGALTSTDWNTFNTKMGGSGTSGQIPYFTGSTTLAGETSLSYDVTKNRLGVQVGVGNEAAAMHLLSDTSTAITGPTAFSATLTPFVIISEPSSSSAPSQIPGRLMNPDSLTETEDASGATSYQIGDTLQYRIVPYNDASGQIGCAQYSDTGIVTMAGSNNGVDITWSDDATGSETISGYYIYRDYNSGGYVDYVDLGYVTSWNDDGSLWQSGSYPLISAYGDYIADGTSRDYEYFSRAVIGPGPYFSALSETATTFTDDSSNKPYGVRHNINSGEALIRIIGTPTGSGTGYKIDGSSGVDIDEYENTWTDGDASPNSVGYTSDGSALTRGYTFYKTQSVNGNTVYSAGTGTGTSDPSDASTYYVTLTGSWPSPSSGSKIISTEAAGGKTITGGTSMTWYDTNSAYGTDFPDDSSVTPEGIIPPALIVEKEGNSNSFAWLTVKGTDNYSKQEFTSSADAVQGKLESSTTEFAIGYNTAKNIRLNATQLGFYNVTPVSRATTGTTAAAFVANTSGIADDTATWGGYSVGQIVAALKAIGILT